MRLLAISLALALAPVPVVAGTSDAPDIASIGTAASARLELARQFVSINMSSKEYADAMLEGTAAMKETLVEEYENDPQQVTVSLAMDKLMAQSEARIRALVPQFYEASAQFYAREFTEDELRVMIGFANSPAGRHYIEAFSKLEEDPAVSEAQDAIWEEMDATIEKIGHEFCTRHADEQIALGEEAECPYAEESVTRRS